MFRLLRRERHSSLTDNVRAHLLRLVRRHASGNRSARLPSEAELCETLNVSRTTVRRAMDQLVAAGEIVRQHGRGAFAVRKARRVASSAALVGLAYRPHQINDYTGKIIASLDRAARRLGMRTTICTELGDVDAWKPSTGLPTRHGPIAGFISNAFDLDELARLEARRIPTICLNGTQFLGRARYVIYEGPDNFTIPFQRLLELGHAHLAYVGPNTHDRALLKDIAPFRFFLRSNYPEAILSLVPCGGELTDMPATARSIAESDPPLTGLLVYDDLIAAWLIAALQKVGRRVPEDISIIAFNSFTDIRASLAVEPQLSCMELRYDAIADLALGLFRKILEGSAPSRKRVVTTRQLIERESTAPACHVDGALLAAARTRE